MTDERDAGPIVDFLLREGARIEPPALVDSLAHRLTALGLKVDRFSIAFGLLHPSLLAAGFLWRPDRPMQFTSFGYDERDSGLYERSPFRVAHETGKWVNVEIDKTPDSAFGVIPDLRAEGIKHYHVMPLTADPRSRMSMTLATKSPDGFSAEQKALVEAIIPAIGMVVEIGTLRTTLHEVLAAYVGREPSRQIIEGRVHRGNITPVRAAIMVSDLRGFTHLSTQMPPEATANVINRYYDVVVPHITQRGGEVLKFIGDAVLAIFPAEELGDDVAILSALNAGRAALAEPSPPYELDGRSFPIRFGIAVHFGEAVYGNVGTGNRLDFTVIGRDVNVAARLAALCSRLGRDYLVSEEVATVGRAHGRIMTSAGSHEVRGIDTPLKVYVPDATAIGENHDDGVSQGHWLAPTLSPTR